MCATGPMGNPVPEEPQRTGPSCFAITRAEAVALFRECVVVADLDTRRVREWSIAQASRAAKNMNTLVSICESGDVEQRETALLVLRNSSNSDRAALRHVFADHDEVIWEDHRAWMMADIFQGARVGGRCNRLADAALRAMHFYMRELMGAHVM